MFVSQKHFQPPALEHELGVFGASLSTAESMPTKPKIAELHEQLKALENRKVDLEKAQENLTLPLLTPATVAALLAEFDAVFASGTNPQKKHLLHHMVKKVLVHDRKPTEVWYSWPGPSPNGDPVRTQPHLAPEVGLEPTTLRLTAGCSAIELLRNSGSWARKPGKSVRPPGWRPLEREL